MESSGYGVLYLPSCDWNIHKPPLNTAYRSFWIRRIDRASHKVDQSIIYGVSAIVDMTFTSNYFPGHNLKKDTPGLDVATVDATRGRPMSREVVYGIKDVWDDMVRDMEERSPTIVRNSVFSEVTTIIDLTSLCNS
ncbi:hypothetical protein Tco_0533964 [Tanacetum coccineum]